MHNLVKNFDRYNREKKENFQVEGAEGKNFKNIKIPLPLACNVVLYQEIRVIYCVSPLTSLWEIDLR